MHASRMRRQLSCGPRRTFPKGPVWMRSTSWYSLFPENITSLTIILHFRSSARSSSSCTLAGGAAAVSTGHGNHPGLLSALCASIANSHCACSGTILLQPQELGHVPTDVWCIRPSASASFGCCLEPRNQRERAGCGSSNETCSRDLGLAQGCELCTVTGE